MNILFVSTDYPERGQPTTGLPNYLYRVSLSLIQLGHKPMILASGRWDAHRVEQEIEIWTVQVTGIGKFKSQSLEYAVNALHKGYVLNKKIKKILREKQIDIIQFTSLQGLAIFYHENVPAVLRLSSYAKTAFATFQTYSPRTVRVMSFIERFSAHSCNVIFAPCRINAEIFGFDCGRKVKVIESPFVNDVLEYDNKYIENNLKDKKYVLFFGALYVEKGILVISEILERFLNKNKEYFLVFIGDTWHSDGEQFVQLLKRKAGRFLNRVLIWNALPHKQLYPIIMHADFVILPSLMENLSNACIEAMYFRRVVIGTDGASFEQLIKHGESGLLCKIGDSEDLLEKMQIAVQMNEDEKMQMGIKAKQRIALLTPEYVVKQLIQLYKYVIKNKTAKGE